MKNILIIALLMLIPSMAMSTEIVTPTGTITCPTTKGQDPGKLVVPVTPAWTFQPAINISVLSLNLRTNQVASGVIPGVGYGLSWKDTVALDAFADFQVGEGKEPSAVGLSLMLNIVKYFSAGVGMLFSKGSQPQYQLLIGGAIPLKID